MLNAQESKIVITTLTQRRAWLRKTLEDASLGSEVLEEHRRAINLLDSAMKKLAAIVSKADKTPPASPNLAPTGKRKNLSIENARILVAEDEKTSAEMLIGLLEDMGVRCIEHAEDGRTAFDNIKNTELAYDFILCDWDMPELSGMQVYEKAKASNTLKGAHFCMVTGVTEAMKIRQAIQGGVNDYIVKPVDGDTLEAKLKAVIQARNQA